MAQYSLADLAVLDDPIAMLRKRPSMYAGEKPRGPRFAARLMRDLILLDALPAQVRRIDTWWLISADTDWLLSVDDVVSTSPFFHIVPFPAGGHAYHRTEVLLTAFADAVVTFGVDGLTWISGDQGRSPLPVALTLQTPNHGRGRLVAFKID